MAKREPIDLIKDWRRARLTSMRTADAMLRDGREILGLFIPAVFEKLGLEHWYNGWGADSGMFSMALARENPLGAPEGTEIRPPLILEWAYRSAKPGFDLENKVWDQWRKARAVLPKGGDDAIHVLLATPMFGFKATRVGEKVKVVFMPSWVAAKGGSKLFGGYPDGRGGELRFGAFRDWEKELASEDCRFIRHGLGLEHLTAALRARLDEIELARADERAKKRLADG